MENYKEIEKNEKKINNIFWKIQQVQINVQNLKKSEKNFSQNYKFFNEFQVLQILKELLEKFGIIILISDDPSQPFIHRFSEDKKENYISYLKKVEIINSEDINDKATFSFWSCANGYDLAKAKGASDTYTNKYALSKLFLIAVEDDKNDPDYDKNNASYKDIFFKM